MEANGDSVVAGAGSSENVRATGISFSITKKSALHAHVGAGGPTGEREGPLGAVAGVNGGDEGEKDMVFSLEGGQIHSSKPVLKKEYVIPLMRKVVWRGVGSEKGGEGVGEGDQPAKSEAELALDKEAAKAIMADLEGSKSGGGDGMPVIPLLLQNKPPVSEDAMETGELADLSMRPEPSTEEEYDEMPIAEFGKALLRGMGWKEGTAIGKTNKGMINPVEFVPRMGKLGLGAAPKPEVMPAKKRPRKPGDTDKKVVQGPYIGTDGRVKHTRQVGEEIPEQPIEGYRPGNYARVLSGPHVGLCGKIVSADEDSCRVTLKLAINGQVLDFSQHRLELISRDEYKMPPPASQPSSSYGLIIKKGVSDEEPCSSKSLLQTTVEDREFRDTQVREIKKRGADSHPDTKHKKAKRSKHSSHDHSGELHSSKSSEKGGHGESLRERLWVAPCLRVRIVDTKFRGGRYYNNKVEILDVVSRDQCVCQTAEGRHLEGVHQSMLETVVPKNEGSAVMIVGGKKNKRQIGRILERDSKNYKATIELVHSSKILTVDYDDICEYTGDVED